ncbi:MAG: DUF2330 domain-containing protein [Myxococcales bacterium]|nr:DUF2330 domain-containing protein [Myxococcales bacterium]
MRFSLGLSSLVLPAAAAALLWTHATPASACGGTFCDAGPQGMPVDQTGENILFAFDGSAVEVHIQIAYDPNTDASKFSWVIPVQSLPEFYVGSEILFDNVLNGTRPFYGVNSTNEICSLDDNNQNGSGAPDAGGTSGATGSASDGDTGGGNPGPSVVYQGTVGAFDITVLSSGSTQELLDWFDANGYGYDDAAIPIIDSYLAENNLFAAFKLVPAEKPVVHPVVLRYEGVEPCVPIRLTQVAAVEDMDIRVFFLGGARAIPTNYRHVLINPLMIDWPNFAANYKEVITAAVDAFAAEGNAFVTEYAGTSSVISQNGIYNDAWNSDAFVGLPAVDVVNNLIGQGIMDCWDNYGDLVCELRHPLLQGLLDEFLPVPQGITPFDFYNCESCFEAMIDLDAWGDGSAFAAAYEERIVGAGKRALSLLQSKPYVTRMYTTISPHEMGEDPIFAETSSLGDIPSQNIAQRLIRCDGHAEYTLPDGREVFVPDNGPWPVFPDEMPYEEETQQAMVVGAPQVLNNNTETIDRLLLEWNTANRPSYDTGAESGGDGEGAGCGCVSTDSGGGLALSLGLLGFAGLGLRRRRR